jgi:hypothetical protein
MLKQTKPAGKAAQNSDEIAVTHPAQVMQPDTRVPAGIVIGLYLSTDPDGRVWLHLPGPEPRAVSAASCLCDLTRVAPGSRVAVMFVEGRAELPVVVGPVLAEFGKAEAGAGAPETIELTATKRLVLKCGDATVRLLADGSAVLRGEQVTTRAKRTNRIRGGNVQIN